METQGPDPLCGTWLVHVPPSVGVHLLDVEVQQTDLCRWSFGSDRLQVKAEIQILMEVESVIQSGIAMESTPASLQKALQEKQDLVLLLLKSEQARLMVWLYPLEHNRKYHLLSGNHEKIAINNVCQTKAGSMGKPKLTKIRAFYQPISDALGYTALAWQFSC